MESQAHHAQLISHDPLHAALPILPHVCAGGEHGDRLRDRLSVVLQLVGYGRPGDGSRSATLGTLTVLLGHAYTSFPRCARRYAQLFREMPWQGTRASGVAPWRSPQCVRYVWMWYVVAEYSSFCASGMWL